MIALILSVALASAPAWEPAAWPAPAPGVSGERSQPAPRPGFVEAAFRWYRARSQDDGAVCPFYPTCSGYGLQSWRSWGFPVSLWLTTDRLLREYPWMGTRDDYPIVTPHGAPRFHDPPPARRRARR